MSLNDSTSIEPEPLLEIQTDLIVLSHELYPEDSLGYKYFPEILEGRLRPVDFADRSIETSRKAKHILEELGILTVSGLLHIRQTELDSVPKRQHRYIKNELTIRTKYLEDALLVTPHGRVISAVFGEKQGPVEPNDEAALVQAVENILSNLDERSQRVMRLRFGMDSWQPQLLEEVGRELGIKRDSVRQIELKALAKFRDPHFSNELKKFMTLPLRSVGRLAGYTYKNDLPKLPISIKHIGLSKTVTEELQRVGDLYLNGIIETAKLIETFNDFEDFLLCSLVGELSMSTKAELVSKLRSTIDRHSRYQSAGDLLPEISVPYGVTGVVRNTLVQDLNLSNQAIRELRMYGYHTLGSLLDVKRDEAGKVIPFSPAVVKEIGTKAAVLSVYLEAIIEGAQAL